MVARNLDKIGGIPLGTGILLGIVIDNVDTGTPDRGRCKVWFPLIHGPEQPEGFELPFAENALSFGGLANTGFVIIPEIGASVSCGFQLGFIEKPIMLGYWYGQEGLPDQHPTGETRDKVLTLQRTDSESGDRFLLQIDFTTNSFKVVRTTSGEGGGDDVLEVGEDGIKVEIAEGSSIELNREGNVIVNAQGDAQVTALGTAKIDSPNVELGQGALEALVKHTAFKAEYDVHTHPTAGTGPPSPPTAPLTPATATQTVIGG